MIHTYIKWAGNKSKLWSHISKRIPQSYGNYYEPFLGSGATFFNIVAYNENDIFDDDRKYILSDTNEMLINCHLVVRDLQSLLKNTLLYFENNHCKDFYNEERKKKLSKAVGEDVKAAARFIYLNKRCYGGLYRENKKGEFNVPMSGDQVAPLCSSTIDLCSLYFKKASISISDYSDALKSVSKNDFIFVDPPYVPISETSNFTAYTKGKWKQQQHEKLFSLLHELDRRKVFFMLTNNDCDFVREKMNKFNFGQSIEVPRYIDALRYNLSDGESRTKETRDVVKECIVTNY